MKKNILYFLIAAFAFLGCRKETDHVFDSSPDERINAKLAEYQSALESSATGWKATIITGSGALYHFYFRFNNENRVFMFSDFDTTTAKYQKESSYRLKALQQPSLIFDTYSYLHILADPDNTVNGGIKGQGLQSDFEFSLDTLYADSILLTGRVNKTKLKLERATQGELDEWQNGQWADALSFLNLTAIQNYFKQVTLDGVKYEIFLDPATRSIRFQWLSGGALQQLSTSYIFTAEGLTLLEPVVNGAQTITGFTDIVWDETNMTLHVKVNNIAGTVKGAIKPLKVDLNAPERWWQTAADAGDYWISDNGFHVNGADDAFGINTLDKYYYLIYWPDYGSGNDLFAPIFINAAEDGIELQYGTAPAAPEYTPDGRAVFSLLGDYGTYPATGPAALSKAQLIIPEGYYFVQTGASSYDMVSAVDAKTWISWSF